MHLFSWGDDQLFISHTNFDWRQGYAGYATARTGCRGSRAIHIPKHLHIYTILLGVCGVCGVCTFLAGGAINYAYSIQILIGGRGMRGMRLPARVAGVCERFIPQNTYICTQVYWGYAGYAGYAPFQPGGDQLFISHTNFDYRQGYAGYATARTGCRDSKTDSYPKTLIYVHNSIGGMGDGVRKSIHNPKHLHIMSQCYSGYAGYAGYAPLGYIFIRNYNSEKIIILIQRDVNISVRNKCGR